MATNIYTELQNLNLKLQALGSERYPEFDMKKPELVYPPQPKRPEVKASWTDGMTPVLAGIALVFMFCLTVGQVLMPILAAFAIIALPVVFAVALFHNHNVNLSKVGSCPEYQQDIENRQRAYARECEIIKTGYDIQMKSYEEAYNEYIKAKAQWADKQNAKIKEVSDRIAEIEAEIRANNAARKGGN